MQGEIGKLEVEEKDQEMGVHRLDEDEDDVVLHVHDLPQIYTRPTYEKLLSTLSLLTYTPPTISLARPSRSRPTLSSSKSVSNAGQRKKRVQVNPTGITSYLTVIISSPLGWLSSDAQREEIWELAGKRLSERAGRTATGDLVRSFRIPVRETATNAEDAEDEETVELTLHEPSLTEDNLGLKTWGSSLVVAAKLVNLTGRWLPKDLQNALLAIDTKVGLKSSPTVLELGSGTGLLGLAAACIWPAATVTLTDLEAIVGNLKRNVEVNTEALKSARRRSAIELAASQRADEADNLDIQVSVLDWSISPSFTTSSKSADSSEVSSTHSDSESVSSEQTETYDIVLASDPLYSPLHPRWLVNTIHMHLSRSNPNARVIVAYPLRKGYDQERAEFEKLMYEAGMTCLEKEVVNGVTEDWGNGDDDEPNPVEDDDEHRKNAGESVQYAVWSWI